MIREELLVAIVFHVKCKGNMHRARTESKDLRDMILLRVCFETK